MTNEHQFLMDYKHGKNDGVILINLGEHTEVEKFLLAMIPVYCTQLQVDDNWVNLDVVTEDGRTTMILPAKCLEFAALGADEE